MYKKKGVHKEDRVITPTTSSSPQLGWADGGGSQVLSTDKHFEKVEQNTWKDVQVYETVLPFVYSHRAARIN